MFFLICLFLIGGGIYFVLQQRKCANAPVEKKKSGKKTISSAVVNEGKEKPKSEQKEVLKEKTEDSVSKELKISEKKEMNKETKEEKVSVEETKKELPKEVSKKETSTKDEKSAKKDSIKEIISKTPVWKPYSQMTMEEKQEAGLLQEKTYGKYLTDEQLVAPKDSLEIIAKSEANPMPLRPLLALPGGAKIALAPHVPAPADPKKRRRRKKKSASDASRTVSSILSKSASLISDFTQHSESSPTRLLMEAEEVPEQPPYSPTFYVAPTKLTSSWPEVGEVPVDGPPPEPLGPVLTYRPRGMKKVRLLSKDRIRKKKSLSASEISM